MKNQKSTKPLVLLLLLLIFSATAFAQEKNLIKRSTYKSDSVEFGMGGTISISGAPEGSITVEGWNKNEIEISAEIETKAATEADLARLAEVNGFVVDPGVTHVRITTVGAHDKDYLKRAAKKFPKNLIGTPFRIDYKIKVPRYSTLNVSGGKGDFSLKDVDGEINVNFLDSNARLALVGGSLTATFGSGTVELAIATRGWRGRFADVQLASGTMNVLLPSNFNAEVEASILRGGKIENTFGELKPKAKSVKFTDKSVVARAGSGGVPLKFTVGDGDLKIGEFKNTP